jgi:hypothetical protein
MAYTQFSLIKLLKLMACSSISLFLGYTIPLSPLQLKAIAQTDGKCKDPLVEIVELRDVGGKGNRYYKNSCVYIKEVGEEERERALKFWTPERIKQARPIELNRTRGRKPRELKTNTIGPVPSQSQSVEQEVVVPSYSYGEDPLSGRPE